MIRKLLVLGVLVTPSVGLAQSLVITNARLIDGTGLMIDSGTLVVTDGRIASIGAGAAPEDATNVVDATGMTVMPGFIDAHRHIMPYIMNIHG